MRIAAVQFSCKWLVVSLGNKKAHGQSGNTLFGENADDNWTKSRWRVSYGRAPNEGFGLSLVRGGWSPSVSFFLSLDESARNVSKAFWKSFAAARTRFCASSSTAWLLRCEDVGFVDSMVHEQRRGILHEIRGSMGSGLYEEERTRWHLPSGCDERGTLPGSHGMRIEFPLCKLMRRARRRIGYFRPSVCISTNVFWFHIQCLCSVDRRWLKSMHFQRHKIYQSNYLLKQSLLWVSLPLLQNANNSFKFWYQPPSESESEMTITIHQTMCIKRRGQTSNVTVNDLGFFLFNKNVIQITSFGTFLNLTVNHEWLK